MNYAAEAKRAAAVREMTEKMRALDPEGFDAAAASVRKNIAAALKYQPQLFAASASKKEG